MEDINVGFSAGAPLPPTLNPIVIPANVTNVLQFLSVLAPYMTSVDNAASTLPGAVSELTPVASGTSADSALGNITSAYQTITGDTTLGTPATIASSIGTANSAISAYATSAQTTIAQQDSNIATLQGQLSALQTQNAALQAQISALQSGKPAVPVPVTPPTQMSTTTFAVGVAAVLAIGGGVWWVARNAKTKAREAHAAGVLTKKPTASAAANPKRLTAGGGR